MQERRQTGTDAGEAPAVPIWFLSFVRSQDSEAHTRYPCAASQSGVSALVAQKTIIIALQCLKNSLRANAAIHQLAERTEFWKHGSFPECFASGCKRSITLLLETSSLPFVCASRLPRMIKPGPRFWGALETLMYR